MTFWAKAGRAATLNARAAARRVEANVVFTKVAFESMCWLNAISTEKCEAVIVLETKQALAYEVNLYLGQIDDDLDKGICKLAIAKLLDVSPNTLYEWLKVSRLVTLCRNLATNWRAYFDQSSVWTSDVGDNLSPWLGLRFFQLGGSSC